LVIAFGPACSNSSTGTGTTTGTTTSTPVPQSQVVDRIVSMYCDGYRGCCTSSGFAFNQTACDAFFRGGASANPLCPNGTYDPVAAGECLQAYETAYAACQKDPPASSPAVSACSRVCTGTVPIGAPCTKSQECAPSVDGRVECSYPPPQLCVLYRRGKAGDPCGTTCTSGVGSIGCSAGVVSAPGPDAGVVATSNTECFTNDGLFCPSTGSPTCQPLAPLGGACSGSNACPAGAYCAAGTCQPQKAAGAACTWFDQCAGTCNLTTKLCEGLATVSAALKVSADICNGAFPSN
jgi:hypothetical protein